MELNSVEYRSSEAVKTWMDGSERRFDTFTIAEYPDYSGLLARDEDELNVTLEWDGLQSAMNEAEKLAVQNGYLDPNRADGRVFFENDAPSDPFTTIREREMQNDVKYSFDYNQFGDDALALEAHKAWREPDGTERSDFILLDLHEGDSGGQVVERFEAEVERLTALQQTDGLQAAMNEAERMAVANGLLDGERTDPRLFTQGPSDPFTTIRERELAREVGEVTEMDTEPYSPVTLEREAPDYPTMYEMFAAEATRQREANASLEGAAWFEATFEKTGTELLQPVHDTVNYAVVVQMSDPWTRELAVEKYWKEPGGYLGVESMTLNTYDPHDETEREQAEQARGALLEVYDERGLEALMHKAELTAMQNDWLDGDRADPRLFTKGPADRFETLAQRHSRPVQEHPTVRRRDAEFLTDFAGLQAEVLPHHECLGGPGGQPLQALLERSEELLALERGVRFRPAAGSLGPVAVLLELVAEVLDFRIVVERAGRELAARAADRIDDLVLENAGEPRAHVRLTAEAAFGGECGSERLLHDVFRRFRIAQLQAREAQEVRALLFDLGAQVWRHRLAARP